MEEKRIKEMFKKYSPHKLNEFHHIYPKILLKLIEVKKDNDSICIFEIGNRSYETLNALLAIDKRIVAYGIDIGNDSSLTKVKREKLLADYPNRINLFSDSQGNKDTLTLIARSALDKYGGFDLIIDDGSHKNEHMLSGFDLLSNYMKPEGIYSIEDIECMYGNDIFPEELKEIYREHNCLIPTPDSYHQGLTVKGFIEGMIDVLNRDFLKRVELSKVNNIKIPRRHKETIGHLSILGRDDLISSIQVYTNCLIIYFGYNLSKPNNLGGINPMEKNMIF